MDKKEEIKVLDEIYQVSEMGIVGIREVIASVKEEELQKLMQDEQEEYDSILTKAESIYKSYGMDEKPLSKMTKLSSEMMSKMKLLKDDSTQNIAKMMSEGTNTAILKITKLQNEYQGNDEELKKLIQELLQLLEHNLEDVKDFL